MGFTIDFKLNLDLRLINSELLVFIRNSNVVYDIGLGTKVQELTEWRLISVNFMSILNDAADVNINEIVFQYATMFLTNCITLLVFQVLCSS